MKKYYVSKDGSGDGSIGNPYGLEYALRGNSNIKPGDQVLLRGYPTDIQGDEMTDAEKLAVFDDLLAATRLAAKALIETRIEFADGVATIRGKQEIVPALLKAIEVVKGIDLSDVSVS